MGKQISNPRLGIPVYPGILPVSKGGTGGGILGGILKTQIGSANGVFQISQNSEIPASAVPTSVAYPVTVVGESYVILGTSNTFTITNYDKALNYSISVSEGICNRTGETITVILPNSISSNEIILTVNSREITLPVTSAGVVKPSIISPLDQSGNHGSSVSFVSSGFAVTAGNDVHDYSDWQISLQSDFSTLAFQITAGSANKTSYSPNGLLPSTTYYIRVRHHGTAYGYSDWSSVVSFSTKSSFIPSVEIAKLLASDGAASDRFGWSVSVSSDSNTAVIGSQWDDSVKGSAYVFTRSGVTWTQQAKLLASDGATSDRFGSSVSISSDGNTAVIGAEYDDSSWGSAYVFTRSGTTWTQQAKLVAGDRAADDYFGYSVSVSGDGNTAVIGAYYDDLRKGSAYVFTRSGVTWTQQAKLVASDGAPSDRFGSSVSISSDGNTAVIGAEYDDDKGADSGSAYVFTRSGVTWTQQAKLVASDGAAGDYFGNSVSVSGDGNTAVIGAYYDDSGKGSAYIFS